MGESLNGLLRLEEKCLELSLIVEQAELGVGDFIMVYKCLW